MATRGCRRQVKRKSTEFTSFAYYSPKQSPHKSDCHNFVSVNASVDGSVPLPESESEDGSDDSTDLRRAVKQFTGIVQKFKRKLKMEVDRKASQIVTNVSHNIHTQLHTIQSQIQSDIVKYRNLCKAKHRQWEANVQDEKEKLKVIHEKFKKDLAHHAQSCQLLFSQIEGQQIELKSIGERQKVSHKKLVSEMQEIIESQVCDGEGKIAALREAAGNHMQALKGVIGQTL